MRERQRRLISREKEIVERVYENLNGQFTKYQILNVLQASLAYIENVARFTDVMSIKLFGVGTIKMNLKGMRWRRRLYGKVREHIGKTESWHRAYRAEMEALDKKIAELEKGEATRKKGDKYYADMSRYLSDILRSRGSLDNVEDTQDRLYNL